MPAFVTVLSLTGPVFASLLDDGQTLDGVSLLLGLVALTRACPVHGYIAKSLNRGMIRVSDVSYDCV